MRAIILAAGLALAASAAVAQTVDQYGRTLACTGTGPVTCRAAGLTVTAAGLPQAVATFNAMAPPDWVAPNPIVISSAAFLARFTPTEQMAIYAACNANPALGVGLEQGITSGQVNLADPSMAAWLAGLVSAGALTAARAAAVIVP